MILIYIKDVFFKDILNFIRTKINNKYIILMPSLFMKNSNNSIIKKNYEMKWSGNCLMNNIKYMK